MSSIFNSQNIERMRVNGNEIALAKINGNVVFQKNKLIKTFYGDSKQETTTGKNLFDYSYYYDNYIDNGSQYYIYPCILTLKSNTNYTVSTNTRKDEWHAIVFIRSGSNTDTSITSDDNGVFPNSPRTIATDSNGNCVIYIKLENLNNENFQNGIFWVQIEEGSTATEFESYTGGIPSPNPDYPQEIKSISGVSLKLTGKNLFNINKYVEDDYNYYSLENDNLICEVIDSRTQGFVYTNFEKGTYTVSTTNVCNISIHEENSTDLFLKKQNINQFTFTLEEDKNLHFKFFNDNVPYNIGKVQIEKGSQIIPINLQGNILAKVGDYVDELQVYSNGDIVLNQKIEKIIFNGSENWIISSLNLEEFSSFYIENILDYNNGEDDVPMICDYFIQKDFVNWEDLLSESFIENASNTVGIRLPKKIASTLEEFKNWLQSNNIEVYYVLQNSTTIKVDNIKEELNSFGDYSNIEIETTYS